MRSWQAHLEHVICNLQGAESARWLVSSPGHFIQVQVVSTRLPFFRVSGQIAAVELNSKLGFKFLRNLALQPFLIFCPVGKEFQPCTAEFFIGIELTHLFLLPLSMSLSRKLRIFCSLEYMLITEVSRILTLDFVHQRKNQVTICKTVPSGDEQV